MELKMEQAAIPEKIVFNYDELKAWATDIAKSRENIVFTGTKEEISARKKDRADLNSIDKALNDERIRWEKKYMEPFNAFKAQIDEVRGIIKNSSSVIDGQIKEIEEQQRQEKKKKIAGYFFTAESPEWLTLPMIWDERWLNASVSMKSIQDAVDARIECINSDLATLSDLPEFSFEAIETYKTTLDLNKSIAEGHRLSEMQKRKAEQERIKAEQEKARAEQERLRKEQEKAKAGQEEAMRNQMMPSLAERGRQAAAVTPEEIAESAEIYREAANVGGVHMQEELPTYVCFKVLLTVAQALELKEFFESRNIEFSRI